MEKVSKIRGESIKLAQLLKYEGIAETGGIAGEKILSGEVCLNGEVCREKNKKLRPGDKVSIGDENIRIEAECV